MPKLRSSVKKISSAKTPVNFSLIVPAYRCNTIQSDIQSMTKILDSLSVNYEIICVIDGLYTLTDKTLKLAQAISHRSVHIVHYPINRGKGFAVRTGFALARGQIIGFMDAGNDIAPESLAIAYELIQRTHADIIVGSKQSSFSRVHTIWQRHLYSSLLYFITQFFFNLPVRDTQVGLKIFQAKVIKRILPQLSINRWAFDLELLVVAKKMGFTNMVEAPVRLTYNYASTVTTMASVTFFWEFIQIFVRLHLLKKYRKK